MDEQQFENVKQKIADDLSIKSNTNGQAVPHDLEWVKSFMVTDDDTDDEEQLIKINGVDVGSLGNHSLILGKKKSRKTFFILLMIKDYLGDMESEVLWFDTEQSKKHCKQIRDKVKQITGRNLNLFRLRGVTRLIKREVISISLRLWPTKVKLVIIDGIRDLVSNINNEDEISQVMEWLERHTVSHNIHIINVLHMNKKDTEARGHLGSELANKAQTVIEIEKDVGTSGALSNVRCSDSRDEPFSSFQFGHDENGLPSVWLGARVKKDVLSEEEIKQKLKYVFEDGGDILTRPQMEKGVKAHFKIGVNKAREYIAEWINQKHWIIRSGREHSKNTTYKLMI